MRDGLGDWIGRHLQLGVERQAKDADKELKACGVPIETLRQQREHQKESQLSLRARKYSSLLYQLVSTLTCFI